LSFEAESRLRAFCTVHPTGIASSPCISVCCRTGPSVSERSHAAGLWGEWSAQWSPPVVASLLEATADVHGLTLATRNRIDVMDIPVAVVDSWNSRQLIKTACMLACPNLVG
jgi:hypothetical protein